MKELIKYWQIIKQTQNSEIARIREEVSLLSNNRQISDETKGTQIETLKAELINIYLDNKLKVAGWNKTTAETEQIKTAISQMAQKLTNETNEVAIKQQMADFETKWGKDAGSILKQLVGKIIKPRNVPISTNHKKQKIHEEQKKRWSGTNTGRP